MPLPPPRWVAHCGGGSLAFEIPWPTPPDQVLPSSFIPEFIVMTRDLALGLRRGVAGCFTDRLERFAGQADA